MRGRGDRLNAGIGGLGVWLLARLWTRGRQASARLELLERIALGPRQSLALVEAEGVRLLVATSAEGAPAFYRLNGREQRAEGRTKLPPRISW